MKSLKVISNLLLSSSFFFLFLIIELQGVRIERLEKQVVTVQSELFEIQKTNNTLKKDINECDERYKRLTLQTMDLILQGGWE